MRTALRAATIIVAIALILAASSASYRGSLYVGRELWTNVVDPAAPLNTQLVPVRGWPAAFLVKTPLGWRFTAGEFAINLVLALPLATIGYVAFSVLRRRRLLRRLAG